MNRYELHLHISPEQYLDYYRGIVRHVVAPDKTGRAIQFPASLLQRFITPEGIQGEFVLICDANFKNSKLEKA